MHIRIPGNPDEPISGRVAAAVTGSTPPPAMRLRMIGSRKRPLPPETGTVLGVLLSRGQDVLPLTANRHLPDGRGCGWFVWRGEDLPDESAEAFTPVPIEHVAVHAPELVPYLAMPPGWAVILAPGYEDVWFDEIYLTP